MSCHGVNSEPGTWPASHSWRSRTSSSCSSGSSARRSASASAASRSVCSTGWRSWRQLVMPPASRPATLRTPTDSASCAARRPSASSRPMNTISRSWSASQASLEPKPELNDGMQIEPRDVHVVELQVGAHVDEQRAFVALELHLVRRTAACALDSARQQRAAVERDDLLEVGRLRAELGDRLRDELAARRRSRASGCAGARSRSSSRSSCPCRRRRTSSRRGATATPRTRRAASAAARARSGRSAARPRPARPPGRCGRRRPRTGCRR